MSWMQRLYDTYEQCVSNPHFTQGMVPLLPVGHSSQQAHIAITLDPDGFFLRAEEFGDKTRIIMPVTEKSLTGRTSGCAPHPLADKIQYCAKDFPNFVPGVKSYFNQYEEQLAAWCAFPPAHPKVKAVLAYVQRGTLIKDLLDYGVLHNGDGGPLATKWDLQLKDLFICWRVQVEEDPVLNTWEDEYLRRSWILYDASSQQECTQGLCYVSGSKQPLCLKHPTKIRNPADGAKLISSNDSSGFTFRGRFTDSEGTQACGVGYEVSQKAHSALRMLIARQGYRNDTQVFISWAVSGKPTPKPLDDSYDWLNEPIDMDAAAAQAGPNHTRDAGQGFALRLKEYIKGYAAKLDPTECIVVMGLDSAVANKGRMSIIYYRELLGSEFLERLKQWHTDMAWPQRISAKQKGKDKEMGAPVAPWRICAPAPKAIAEAAYGRRLDDKLKRATVERLLPCIVDGREPPRDLMDSCVRRAANRPGFKDKEHWEWEQALGVACALFKGYFARHQNPEQRRTYDMALEQERTSRDYLYGRLLALAEHIEDMALYVAGESRPTTAARLMQRFADHPCSTWRTIEMALQPYMQRLQASRGGFLHNMRAGLDQVLCLFQPEEFASERRLSGEFLLGYHCQRQELKQSKNSKETENETKGAE